MREDEVQADVERQQRESEHEEGGGPQLPGDVSGLLLQQPACAPRRAVRRSVGSSSSPRSFVRVDVVVGSDEKVNGSGAEGGDHDDAEQCIDSEVVTAIMAECEWRRRRKIEECGGKKESPQK